MSTDSDMQGDQRRQVGSSPGYAPPAAAAPNPAYAAAPGPGYGGDAAVSMVTTASGLNILAGVWLIIAPWVLSYSNQSNAVWNEVVVGAVIALVAAARVAAPRQWAELSWINATLGAWLIIAPFVLSYSSAGTPTARIYWNDILLGAIVLVLALWSEMAGRRRGRASAQL